MAEMTAEERAMYWEGRYRTAAAELERAGQQIETAAEAARQEEREACAQWHIREEARARLKAGEMLRLRLEEAKDCYCAVAKAHAKAAAAIRARKP